MRGRTTMAPNRITLAQARAILGTVRTVDYEEGERATNRIGGITAVDLPPPPNAARLPANWRNVFARCSWLAAHYRPGTNDPKACVMLDGTDAYAGTLASAVAIPFALGGISLPVFIPAEIAWHRIPGIDGAVIWEDHHGYTLQTDAGIRVFAVRETARLDTFPWARMFQSYMVYEGEEQFVIPRYGLPPQRGSAYTRFSIEWLSTWVETLEVAPSDTLELIPGLTELWCREARSYDSPWPLSSISFPVERIGFELSESVWVPKAHLLRAFNALLASSEHGVISMRSPRDNVFLFAADATAIVAPVSPVRVEPHPENLMPPEPGTSGGRKRSTLEEGRRPNEHTRAPRRAPVPRLATNPPALATETILA